MRIIILIIANDSIPQYIEMQSIWKQYMNTHPNITSFFIKNDITIESPIQYIPEENTIYYKDNESLTPGIINKTVKSIEYCLENMEFDYIYRTNLSSFLDLNKMYDYFLKINRIHYGGVIGNLDDGMPFASGCGFVLSKYACKYILKNENVLFESNHYDDVAIGNLLNPVYGIEHISRIDINNMSEEKFIMDENTFHYRCKSDGNHCVTVDIINKLNNKLNNKIDI